LYIQKHILKHIFLFATSQNINLYLWHKPKTIFFTLKIIPIEDLKSDFVKKSLFCIQLHLFLISVFIYFARKSLKE